MIKKYIAGCALAMAALMQMQSISAAADGKDRAIKINLLKENLPSDLSTKYLTLEYNIVHIPNNLLVGVDNRTTRGLTVINELLLAPSERVPHPVVTPNVKKWATNSGGISIDLDKNISNYKPDTAFSKALKVAKNGLYVEPKTGHTPYFLIRYKGAGWDIGPWSIFPIGTDNILNIELQGTTNDKIRGGWSRN